MCFGLVSVCFEHKVQYNITSLLLAYISGLFLIYYKKNYGFYISNVLGEDCLIFYNKFI